MPESRPPCPPDLRLQKLEPARAGRCPEARTREHDPKARTIGSRVAQDDRDAGPRLGVPTAEERVEPRELRRESLQKRAERDMPARARWGSVAPTRPAPTRPIRTARVGTVLTLLAGVLPWIAGCVVSEPGASHGRAAWSVPSDDAIAMLLAERMEHNGVGMVVGVIDGDRRSVLAHGVSGAENGRALDAATVFSSGL